MSYQAIVCKIKTRPHPSADKIKLGTCLGNQVVIGIDTEEDSIGVFFPTDGQLSEEFCKEHDLIAYTDTETGEKKGGFFDQRRRVRAQKFRQEKSDGYWCPISMFSFTGYDITKLKEGDVFVELNNIPICNKYITKATRNATGEKQKKSTRRETPMFPAHFDTEQFRYYADKIKPGSILSITLKLHGSSFRLCHTLDDIELKWYEKLWNKTFSNKIPDQKWNYLNGSRNVILERGNGVGWYGTEEFRYEAVKQLIGNLHKGEIIYGEIVGWVNEQMPIMHSVKTSVLKDKEFTKKYGEEMYFKYGCPQGTRKIYIYRIAYATVDGHIIDLPWNAVKQRCAELGAEPVLEIVSPFVYDGNVEKLRELVESHTEGEDLIDASHIREGCCVRVENGLDLSVYKSKSHTFLVLEGVIKDKDDYVDTEESS